MKILFSNVLKSPSTKLLLIAAALLFVFEANGQMPDAKNNSVVVRIDQPSIMFSFAPNYDVNFLPGMVLARSIFSKIELDLIWMYIVVIVT